MEADASCSALESLIPKRCGFPSIKYQLVIIIWVKFSQKLRQKKKIVELLFILPVGLQFKRVPYSNVKILLHSV